MFEQAILHPQRRPWTLAASLSLQSAIAGTVVLLSIITIDRLPNVALPTPLPPMPRAPKPVEVVMTEIVRSTRAAVSNVFTAPVRIPDRVAMIVEDVKPGQHMDPGIGIAGTGLPGGVYTGNQIYSGDTFAPPPAPATPAQTNAEPMKAAPAKMITIGGNVLEGKIIKRVIPLYPPLARQARISGTVKLHGVIGRDGAVRELQVLSGHPLLIKSAVDAVKQWVYQPTLLNGEPVEVNAPIEVHFTLAQ